MLVAWFYFCNTVVAFDFGKKKSFKKEIHFHGQCALTKLTCMLRRTGITDIILSLKKNKETETVDHHEIERSCNSFSLIQKKMFRKYNGLKIN